jgi:CubicO group peptidase (beta-lactamase class C family)
MPRAQSVFMALLILIGLLGSPAPARSTAADCAPLKTAEHEQIDAYIQSRMRAAHTPGLALGVVRGDQVAYLKGYLIAGPDGRMVTPQTPFILGSTSKSIALAGLNTIEREQWDGYISHFS